MADRSFRPWLVTLVICVGAAVAMVLWVNNSGGYANPPWFLSVGVGVGATLSCLWLVVRGLVTWRWVREDAPPTERGLDVEDRVAAYQGWLANPANLTRAVGPLLRESVAGRLRRHHAVELHRDADTSRVETLVTQRLLAAIQPGHTLTATELPGVLDDLDALLPSATQPAPATQPTGVPPVHRDPITVSADQEGPL